MIVRFLAYGFAGWCIEILWTGLGSLLSGDINLTGYTYLWMFPIYGLGICLEPVHDRVRNLPVFIRGGVYTIIILIIEYSTGALLRELLGACPWDYSGTPFSVNGLIRLDYAPAWFVTGLLFEKFHDALISMQYLRRI
ncbi:putative ABC transporter permease [Fonticella tunisiensis]|uniref:Putative ABC transporter type IV n=1 Tax=Fonticella tunisiensis TaxID=1096341 RepID=A0A4R7KTU1_9CLOT|nr:hypothetical protein [Fonticella tunisiensis]TDT61318.1 putative ABC transporter type IV [Fonticella tunisiensis]